MKIRVVGSGCPTCKRLYETVQQAVKDLGIDAEVEYSTNIQEIVEMGLMQSPILIIDGTLASFRINDLESIKQAIVDAKNNPNRNRGCCE